MKANKAPITPENGFTVVSKLIFYCGAVWIWGQFWLLVLEGLLGQQIKETVWRAAFFVLAWWALNGLITFVEMMKKEADDEDETDNVGRR